ncbi:MAG: hypothetical protein L3J29_07980 [Cyclobacteriaceae bacterium]|nr:hypothetical protein [Cyclobacteriaceae bacterium]
MSRKSKIIRTWKGCTTIENTPIREELLINEVFSTIKKKGVSGLEKVSITIKNRKDEVDFFKSFNLIHLMP